MKPEINTWYYIEHMDKNFKYYIYFLEFKFKNVQYIIAKLPDLLPKVIGVDYEDYQELLGSKYNFYKEEVTEHHKKVMVEKLFT